MGVSLLCATFVAVVLADPTSTSGEYARRALDVVGLPIAATALLAGGIIAGATYTVARDRPDTDSSDERSDQSGRRSG